MTDIAILGNEVTPSSCSSRPGVHALHRPLRAAQHALLDSLAQVPSTLSFSYLPQEYAQMERTKYTPAPQLTTAFPYLITQLLQIQLPRSPEGQQSKQQHGHMELGHVLDGDASWSLHVRLVTTQLASWSNRCTCSYDTPMSKDKYIYITLRDMIQVLSSSFRRGH